jgi:diguanylate cyclase (GGDEF)-like protein
MTSSENPEVAKQKAFSLGATDFVTKPFQATDMRARARSYAQLNLTTRLLKEQTTIDELTGAANLRGLQNQLEKEISFIAKHQCSLSLLTVEIDNYKNLFVSMGRSSAEKIIRHIGQLIINTFRKGDTVARTGLARFSVSMPLVKKENAMEVANKICQTVESFRARLNGKRLNLTVSAGIVSFNPDDSMTPEVLIDMAAKALLKAKALGTSQLYASIPEDFPELRQRTFSVDALLQQIQEGDELVVADQLDDAIAKLVPLISLLSNEQKQRLLTIHNRQKFLRR